MRLPLMVAAILRLRRRPTLRLTDDWALRPPRSRSRRAGPSISGMHSDKLAYGQYTRAGDGARARSVLPGSSSSAASRASASLPSTIVSSRRPGRHPRGDPRYLCRHTIQTIGPPRQRNLRARTALRLGSATRAAGTRGSDSERDTTVEMIVFVVVAVAGGMVAVVAELYLGGRRAQRRSRRS